MATAEPLVTLPDDLPPDVEAWVSPPDDAPADAQPVQPAIDPSLAPRIARRRARIASRLAAREASVQAEIDRLTLWRQWQDERDQREAARLDALLTTLLWHAREQDPKRKSLSLPHGVTVQARSQPDKWERDDAALLSWAQINAPDYIEHRPALLWSRMKRDAAVTADGRAVLPTGEVLQGVVVVAQGERVTVTVAAEGSGAS